MFAVDQIRSD